MAVRVVFDLPADLAGSLLFTWLRFASISRLNSACCSRRERADLESIFEHDTAVLASLLFVHLHEVDKIFGYLMKRKIKITGYSLEKVDKQIPEMYLANCFGRHLQNLQLRGWSNLSPLVICTVPSTFCCNLRVLTLFSVPDLSGINLILRNCQCTLQAISIDGCYLDDKHMFHDLCLTSMKSLKLWNMRSLRVSCFRTLIDACPNLQTLGVRNMEPTVKIMEAAATLPKLCVLSFSGSKLTNSMLAVLCSACSATLVSIDVSKCEKVTDTGIETLVQNCSKLHTISVAGCPLTTDRSLQLIAEHCGSRLLCLEFGHKQSISNIGVRAIADRCHNIKYMSSFYLEGLGISDATLIHLFSRCPLLEQLDISNSKVSTAVLGGLAKHCRKLTYLSVFDAGSECCDGLVEVVMQCSALRTVVIADVHHFWSAFAVKLLKKLRPALHVQHTDTALPCWSN
jgi:hypothetical protein